VKVGAARKGRHPPNEREIAAGIMQVIHLNPQPSGKRRLRHPQVHVNSRSLVGEKRLARDDTLNSEANQNTNLFCTNGRKDSASPRVLVVPRETAGAVRKSHPRNERDRGGNCAGDSSKPAAFWKTKTAAPASARQQQVPRFVKLISAKDSGERQGTQDGVQDARSAAEIVTFC
jgi:hypothetical protein